MTAAIENTEPDVISDDMSLMAIQVEGIAEGLEEKRRQMDFKEVESLSYSFKNLSRIAYLAPFQALTKLQLDNNVISKIENLEHLVNLTWLDLSFNKITKMEGLDKLTKLTDLSLYNNEITTIEGLDSIMGTLCVLSLGNNKIADLLGLMYLRPFRELRLINLAGNDICKDPEYRSYVLSHLKNLKYLDYRLVQQEAVLQAREQNQDEMIELEEKEELEEAAMKSDAEQRTKDALLDAANMSGVEDLFERMLSKDPEYQKLKSIPNKDKPDLVEGLEVFRDKFNAFVEEFKVVMLTQLERKTGERAEWQRVLDGALAAKDGEAQSLITNFDKERKKTFRSLPDLEPTDAEAKLRALHQRNDELYERLMEFEMQIVDIVSDLVGEFDRNYSEIVDGNRAHISNFFTQVRELEDRYYEGITATAMSMLEKFGTGDMEDVVSEDSRTILQDKDTLMNAIQAHHDSHTTMIDGLEDKLGTGERRRLDDMINGLRVWESRRNRDRVAEIVALARRNREAVDRMLEVGDDNE
mmetsp:Transcript_39587/g.98026  ORF Transcript_39587/g.98026 Transcript_39587/m.98026 type:complete len:526 (-) Transcript_39587:264-1841(-)|eukprot:CAMPEP_0197614046 /NCGR_PEP_ID=MMETSP1326-20131121/59326_1 /TAXON_ID=1155430 /ORGANISM="Genus nov. species nov., Strain RCC2288" /LENGTH=525 /DNA_ID=CAMNT_0043182915 /DNA_START=279 /DNA_END=1856 /DNA_ORIENTATION=+